MTGLKFCISLIIITACQLAGAVDVHVNSSDGYMNVRIGPGTEYAIIDKVYNGYRTRLLGKASTNLWLKIRTPSGKLGYVNINGVTVPGTSVAAARVPVDNNIIRNPSPSPDHPSPNLPTERYINPNVIRPRPPGLSYTRQEVLEAGKDIDAAEQFQNRTGEDYQNTVASAVQYNTHSLHELLTPEFFDGAGYEGHAGLVFRIMHYVGDTRFAIAVSRLNKSQKRNVGQWLENEMGYVSNRMNWRDYLKMHFPETANRLGLHNQ